MVSLHPSIPKDLSEALDYYGRLDPALPCKFYAEFEEAVHRAHEFPTRFHFASGDVRRINLESFPYHLLFRERSGQVRILVLRHHRRTPSFGLGRF